MASRMHQPLESDEFDFVLARTAGPVLAYFFGTWPKAAKACKEMDSVVGELASDYAGRLTVIRTDMTRCPGPTKRFGVTGAPSFVLIKDGEAVAGTGPLDRAGFTDFLAPHL
ncbi:thioredoxin family protein [Streptomyces sp. NPDC091272]|uniref:thioredoxin family protein n=1 Tax=Streptomyces sp. NPDC091272 TaxID=3365981 RepID=UPI00381A47FE